MSAPSSLVWLRQDLRLADQPALQAALKRGGPVLPVFIWSPDEEAPWQPGGASRWWLHRSLRALAEELAQLGSRLILRRGPSVEALLNLAREARASTVVWSRRYEPAVIARDLRVQQALAAAGLEVETFNSSLLYEPREVQNRSGRPFQVFTPFWRTCLATAEPGLPLPTPRSLPSPLRWPSSLSLDELELTPKLSWADGFTPRWQPGTAGAGVQLDRFLEQAFARYTEERNLPGLAGTSSLSPHLHFGEISPRQAWYALARHANARQLPPQAWRGSQFLTELGWREFAHHLLFHFPRTTDQPLREPFQRFPWRAWPEGLRAWQEGRTGYPLVDAGLRELWQTGWMHNRVRMVAASFLVKHLLVDWKEGARWFWDTLVDADLASNTLGWQWTAGCGADAAPYFRIFNPVSQAERFDPSGLYVRRWLPELARLPAPWIFRPHEAPPAVLATAGITLGADYPEPIVSHVIAREIALRAYAKVKLATAD